MEKMALGLLKAYVNLYCLAEIWFCIGIDEFENDIIYKVDFVSPDYMSLVCIEPEEQDGKRLQISFKDIYAIGDKSFEAFRHDENGKHRMKFEYTGLD